MDGSGPAKISKTCVFLLVGVILATLGRSCTYDFSWWDDWANIQSNPKMNPPTLAAVGFYFSHFSQGLYVPVTYTIWLAVAAVARLKEPDAFGAQFNPWLFHALNLCIHLITAFLVFRLLEYLTRHGGTRHRGAALVGAMFWAIHPLQVETVCWISGTKDLLAGCFQVAVLYRYVKRAELVKNGASIRILDLPGAILLVLALLSKPSAMMTPLLTFCIDLWIIGRPLKAVLRSTLGWVAVVLPFVVIARLAQTIPSDNHIPPAWIRPFIFSDALVFYVSKLLAPVRLSMDYGMRWWVIDRSAWFYWTAVVIAGIVLVEILLRKRLPWLVAGSLIFVFSLLPVSGLATFEFEQTSTTADHYVYVAMLGPALIVAFLFRGLLQRARGTRLYYCAAGALIVLLAVQSYRQAQTWRDDMALFSHVLEINPASALAHNNLGSGYTMRNDLPDAIREYRAAIAVDPEYYIAYSNLKDRLLTLRDVDGAIQVMKDYVKMYERLHGKDDPPVHLDIARLELAYGRNADAMRECELVEREQPGNQQAAELLNEARRGMSSGIGTTGSASRPSQ